MQIDDFRRNSQEGGSYPQSFKGNLSLKAEILEKNELPQQGQVFIENFMNLLNNALTQINQNIVKNLENPKNEEKGNDQKNRKNQENSAENSAENEEDSNNSYKNPDFFDFPRISPNLMTNFSHFPQEIAKNLTPINPQKFFEEFDLSSEISKNQSEIKESEENESRSEGEITGIVKESKVFEETEENSEENDEIELSEGEIRL